jgi:hypothetical protein
MGWALRRRWNHTDRERMEGEEGGERAAVNRVFVFGIGNRQRVAHTAQQWRKVVELKLQLRAVTFWSSSVVLPPT